MDSDIKCFLKAHGLDSALIMPLEYGGNNRAFEIRDQQHTYFLKQYFHHPKDQRDRLHHEFSFLSFLWNQCGLRNIPESLTCDAQRHIGLYSFVRGRRLVPEEIDERHLLSCLDFFLLANKKKNHATARRLPKGSEASFSARHHFASLEWRINRFEIIQFQAPLDQEAAQFVRRDVASMWKDMKPKIVEQLQRLGIDMDQSLPMDECCLSPSDFGFHNVILGTDGKLYFTDFEYAGWDDVAKMVNDFFCQPEIPAPIRYFNRFSETVAGMLPRSEFHLERIRILRPLHILKWCCLLLNEFLPVAQNRRQFAGACQNLRGKKVQQLEKARRMFQRLHTEEEITI